MAPQKIKMLKFFPRRLRPPKRRPRPPREDQVRQRIRRKRAEGQLELSCR